MDLQVNRCSKCGSCRDVCPVFQELLVESYTPRARVQLIKYRLEGEIAISEKYREIMHMCLVCQCCTSNCPNGVRVHELVLVTRRAINEEKEMNLAFKTALNMMKSPIKQKIARKGIKTYRRLLRGPLRFTGVIKRSPGNLDKIDSILPAVKEKGFRERYPQVITNKKDGRRVVYFTGCMTQMFYPGTGEAVIKVLQAAGYNVFIPRMQVCCGFPDLIYGRIDEARKLAAKNVAIIMRHRPDFIITDCASCGEALQHYAKYFTGISAVEDFSSLVQDISYFLVYNTSLESRLKPVDLSVTYHDPCHLIKGQGIYEEPRRVLQKIPGLKFAEMNNPDRCCGGAGTFNLTYYDMSMHIGRHKLAAINASGKEIVATGCPACRAQISYLLEQYGDSDIRVLHPVEILSGALA